MTTKPSRRRAIDPRRFEVDRALLHRGGAAGAWGNLGDWSVARSYADACEALAVRIGNAARLREGDAILEAACGAGEGMRLWLDHFRVGHTIGVDVHPRWVEEARARLTATAAPARWRADPGDATDLSAVTTESVDAVVCVDAAYHFDPRDRFLREARRVLRPGGRLALSDVVLAAEPRGVLEAIAVAGVARACAIPRPNLCTEETYVARLRRAGFDDVAIERLDDEVLLGFSSFVREHRRAYGRETAGAGWSKLLVTAWGAGLAVRRGRLHYVLASARRAREAA
jgi:microcystin synthetase protein McyJ